MACGPLTLEGDKKGEGRSAGRWRVGEGMSITKRQPLGSLMSLLLNAGLAFVVTTTAPRPRKWTQR